ncbi:MAG TPA: UDP-N-acetylmuramate dehydrogenase [Candidatus Dormibacteraeota bacterium]|nr:UDP-N-acetylmuramate dehydrogenase [Candidatus Dormibacteraeota bacterium]
MSSGKLPDPLRQLLAEPLRTGALRPDEALGRHSQFGVGGPADWYWEPASTILLPDVLRACQELEFPYTVLGAGSNCLILDGGIRGLVLKFPATRAEHQEEGLVRLDAGSMLPRAAFDTAYLGLQGLAFGVGIPGTAGAAAAGNAGAFGSEMGEILEKTEVVLPGGDVLQLGVDDLRPRYRRTALQEAPFEGAVVTQVWLRLQVGDVAEARAMVRRVMRERKASQPTGVRSLGSTFKNPPEDQAGRLIDAAGLKGLKEGAAQVSLDHANFICNLGGARAAEVLALTDVIRQRVQERFGVELELEIIPVGSPDFHLRHS